MRAILQKTENYYLADNQRYMPEADAPLYSTIDEKHNLEKLVEKLRPVADVEVRDNQCIVAVVGRNLMKDSAVGARVFEALRGVPMAMFSLGT